MEDSPLSAFLSDIIRTGGLRAGPSLICNSIRNVRLSYFSSLIPCPPFPRFNRMMINIRTMS